MALLEDDESNDNMSEHLNVLIVGRDELPPNSIDIQLTGADGSRYTCKMTDEEVKNMQTDETFRNNFLERLKNTKKLNDAPLNTVFITTSNTASSSSITGIQENQHKIWSKAETNLLVNLRISREDDFRVHKVHTDLWNEIAVAISIQGSAATSIQCINKWKTLKRNYIALIDSKDESETKTFPYFKEFHDLFSSTPRLKMTKILPDSIPTSSPTLRKSKRFKQEIPDSSFFDDNSEIESDVESLDDDEQCNCIHTCNKRKREPLNDESKLTPVVNFLKEFVDLQRQNIFQQQEYLQKQDEFYSRFSRKLTSLSQKSGRD